MENSNVDYTYNTTPSKLTVRTNYNTDVFSHKTSKIYVHVEPIKNFIFVLSDGSEMTIDFEKFLKDYGKKQN